ncbi:hypothetical protein TPA0910_42080 [Streptomyces hygroscopicus subsp. sporocinereus]|uniref:Uncharacterized protein n=1 Tax=Streptomyces hygroscopicus TaxID=1912 RepID=A0ABQ3U2E5_STRHY|nr:hypothetical protein TPA0910_42080 [Streptomyces hygroscopicus]
MHDDRLEFVVQFRYGSHMFRVLAVEARGIRGQQGTDGQQHTLVTEVPLEWKEVIGKVLMR